MNDRQTTPKHSRMLSDGQVDELLVRFFEHEVPSKLQQGLQQSAGADHLAAATSAARLTVADNRPMPSTGSVRRLTALAAAVAACTIALIAGWQMSGSPDQNGLQPGFVAEPQQPEIAEDQQLLDVSTNPGGGIAVDDVNTSLQEIDQIDLSPVDAPVPQPAD